MIDQITFHPLDHGNILIEQFGIVKVESSSSSSSSSTQGVVVVVVGLLLLLLLFETIRGKESRVERTTGRSIVEDRGGYAWDGGPMVVVVVPPQMFVLKPHHSIHQLRQGGSVQCLVCHDGMTAKGQGECFEGGNVRGREGMEGRRMG